MCPETEVKFNESFWQSLDLVVNALDNVQARLYADSRCVRFKKPLLESGTLGTKFNVQPVVPGLTKSYGSYTDPPEKEIPVCTLKNFPNQIQHTLAWARDAFEEHFVNDPSEVNTLLKFLIKEDGDFRGDDGMAAYETELDRQRNLKLTRLRTVVAMLRERPRSIKDCVHWARRVFSRNFHDTIKQLLHKVRAYLGVGEERAVLNQGEFLFCKK